VLLGRDTEQQALDRLLAEARVGRSGVLAVVGEPGIGKTALLEEAAGRAEGMQLLRARGVESEAEVPFAGLLALLRPVLGALERIPEPQAAALGGALALRPGEPGDRFAVGAATLSLLAAAAEEAPLLVLVDDAHWLDGSSAEALRFAVRRLLADPVAVVLAVRAGEPSLLDGADLPVLALGGLDAAAAADLVARVAPGAGAGRLHAATAGNPLALLELAARGEEPEGLPAERPVALPERLAAAFGRRAEALPDPTRRALLVAAAGEDADLAVLARAAAALGVDVAALGPAEAAGLITLGAGAAEFRHPLVRSAVSAAAPDDERRAAHRALAEAVPPADADRRAWHLAAAVVGPDDEAARALADAGDRAAERRAYAGAAAARERAAHLTADPARRAELLHAAAEAARLVGAAERAEALAAEAGALAPGTALAARAEHLRGSLVARRGPLLQAYAILTAGAEQAAGVGEPELAVGMLAEAVSAAYYAGQAGRMDAAAERIGALLSAEPSERAAFLADSARGVTLMWRGRAEEGAVALRRAVARFEASAELQADPSLHSWALIGPLWLRDTASGRALADGMLAAARAQAAVGVMTTLLHYVARDLATSDQWDQAAVVYDEGVRLSRETGQAADLAGALAGRAWLEARQGRESACRAHAAEARELCRQLGQATYDMWSLAALADLELALGRHAAALPALEAWAARLDSMDAEDPDLSPGPELVEVHLRLGDEAAARAALDAFTAEAERKGRPWALARAARGRVLLAPDAELDLHFAEALQLHAQTPDSFETARTHLAYGARLRRARRRTDARVALRAALETFEALGAAPWADHAGAELAASGETARRRDVSTLDDLTPQERQIAGLLADGRTTREAAAALFISPKTVEYHLRSVYRKLAVRSRAELAGALARSGEPAPAVPSGAR
jgi:DNA-binding CsgD family transcriptional regulator